MNTQALYLDSSYLKDEPLPPKPFWLPLLGFLLFSATFIQWPGSELSDAGNTSVYGPIKFLLRIAGHMIFALAILKNYKGKISRSTDLYLYGAYCVLAMTSVFVYSVRFEEISLIMFARAIDITLFIFAIALFSKMEAEDTFLITFIAISAPVFFILGVWVFFPELAFDDYDIGSNAGTVYRLGGSFLHPNNLGGCAAMALIMTVGLRTKRSFKILLCLAFILVIAAVQSRKIYIAMVPALFGSYLVASKDVGNKLLAGCMLGLTLAVGILLYQFGLGEIAHTRDMTRSVDTLNGRTFLWGIVLSEYFNGNIFDILFGLNPFFATKSIVVNWQWTAATMDNSYIHVLAGAGLLAAVGYIVMLFRLLRVKAPRKGMDVSLRALVIYILITATTADSAAAFMNFYTLVLPLIMGQCYRQEIISRVKKSPGLQN